MPRDASTTRYRVFVSYARDDRVKAQRVSKHLRGAGVQPCSDADIPGGARFDDEIRKLISHCHLFVSLLTRTSQKSAWVLQELGYALGLGIPVLPLTLAPQALPKGMADRIQARSVKPNLSNLAEELSAERIEELVDARRPVLAGTYECAEGLGARTRMLVAYAKELRGAKWPARVRQRVAFSSFSIPRCSPDDPRWAAREGNERRSREERELLREERETMEALARRSGCDLILDPWVSIAIDGKAVGSTLKHERRATFVRLQELVAFVRSMPAAKLRIALTPGRVDESTVILGDWMAASAVVPHYKQDGYRKTLFTRHAPTIVVSTSEFERRLAEGVEAMRARHPGRPRATSQELAVLELEAMIERLR